MGTVTPQQHRPGCPTQVHLAHPPATFPLQAVTIVPLTPMSLVPLEDDEKKDNPLLRCQPPSQAEAGPRPRSGQCLGAPLTVFPPLQPERGAPRQPEGFPNEHVHPSRHRRLSAGAVRALAHLPAAQGDTRQSSRYRGLAAGVGGAQGMDSWGWGCCEAAGLSGASGKPYAGVLLPLLPRQERRPVSSVAGGSTCAPAELPSRR